MRHKDAEEEEEEEDRELVDASGIAGRYIAQRSTPSGRLN